MVTGASPLVGRNPVTVVHLDSHGWDAPNIACDRNGPKLLQPLSSADTCTSDDQLVHGRVRPDIDGEPPVGLPSAGDLQVPNTRQHTAGTSTLRAKQSQQRLIAAVTQS